MDIENLKIALDACINNRPCKSCPYETSSYNFPSCAVHIMEDALHAIQELERRNNHD